MITIERLKKIVSGINKTTYSSDPFPSKLLMSYLPPIINPWVTQYIEYRF